MIELNFLQQKSNMSRDCLGEDVLLFGTGFMAAALVIMGLAAYRNTTVVPSSAEDFDRLRNRLEFSYVARMGIGAAWITLILPDSYDLALDLGVDSDGVVSGWIIGSVYLFAIPFLFFNVWYMRSLGQRASRTIVNIGSLTAAFGPVLVALGANPPSSFGWSGWTRLLVICAGRICDGLCYVSANIDFQYVLFEISTPVQIERLVSNMHFSSAIGIGFGPVMSSIITTVFNLFGVRERVAVSHFIFAPIMAWFVFETFCFYPSDLNALRAMKPSAPITDAPLVKAHQMSTFVRKCLWVCGCIIMGTRGLIVPALEAASIVFLETEFGWTPRSGGYAFGAAFFFGLPAVAGLKAAAKIYSFSTVVLFESCLACVFCFLFFPGVDNVFMPQENTWVLILIADAALFVLESVTLMQCAALATVVSLQDSGIFNQQTFSFMQYLITVLARLVAPVVSRYTILRGSRSEYASIQLGLCFLNVLVAVYIWIACRGKDGTKVTISPSKSQGQQQE